MDKNNLVQWVLRVAVAGEFAGHGVFALQGKAQWVKWFSNFGVTDAGLAAKLLFLIGLMDLAVALIVLVKPLKPVLIWAAIWGFWTALIRPIVGEPIWDFIERWANWGGPLALYLIIAHSNQEKSSSTLNSAQK